MEEKNKTFLVSIMNTIAIESPECLDMVLTDEVLSWALKTAADKIKYNLDNYMAMMNKIDEPDVSESIKNYCENVIQLTLNSLSSDYKLYQAYESLREKRGLAIEAEVEFIDFVRGLLVSSGKLDRKKITLVQA